jgi:hypothetical protein
MSAALTLGGLFAGVFTRSWLPFVRKLREGKIEGFQKKYLRQAAVSVFLAAVGVLLIVPAYRQESMPVTDFISGVQVFAAAFAFGFGSNSIINELMKWREE